MVPVGPGDSARVRLVHLRDPSSGVFSQRKRQCDLWEFVWGTSILFSRLLHRLAPAFRNGGDRAAAAAAAAANADHETDTTPAFTTDLHLRRGNILEVGCGSALCALTCAMSGARRVVATDAVEDAVRVARRSCAANSDRIPAGVMEIACATWEKPEMFEAAAFDLVLGSDVLFGRWTAAPLSRTIARATRRDGIALIADPVRLNVEEFVRRLEELGLSAEVRRFRKEDEHSTVEEVCELAEEREAFVKLTRAKLVVVRWKGGKDGVLLSDVASAMLDIVLAHSELFDEE